MNQLLRLLNPLLAVTFGIGLGKFFWALIGEPNLVIAAHNLTAFQFVGALYLTFRVAARPDLGIRHLWLGNHLLFAYCQGLFLLGSLHAPLAGASLIYFQSESIQYLMGDNPPAAFQPALRLINWVIIAPIVVTWISGAPVLLLRRLQVGGEDSQERPEPPHPEEQPASAASDQDDGYGPRQDDEPATSPNAAQKSAGADTEDGGSASPQSGQTSAEIDKQDIGQQQPKTGTGSQGRLFEDD